MSGNLIGFGKELNKCCQKCVFTHAYQKPGDKKDMEHKRRKMIKRMYISGEIPFLEMLKTLLAMELSIGCLHANAPIYTMFSILTWCKYMYLRINTGIWRKGLNVRYCFSILMHLLSCLRMFHLPQDCQNQLS